MSALVGNCSLGVGCTSCTRRVTEFKMAFTSWEQPMKWIEADKNDKFTVVPQTAARLAQIRQPVAVVAIAGIYRTGKSYLMNRLAGRPGFELGSTLQSHTKGIWIWCIEHPYDKKQVLVLIDTEGLGDPEKGNEKQDMTYFSLAVLLSSTFVFNTIGKIDQKMINDLYFVTELTERIKVKSTNEGEEDEGIQLTDFTQYFPQFVLAVRDFTLELKLNGRDVTPNDYFNYILTLKKGDSRTVDEYNLPRKAIRRAFKNHFCFVFTRPVEDSMFARLAINNVREEDLSPQFRRQSDEFYHYILTTVPIKKLMRGQYVTGQILESLAEEYVKAINMGAVPCIESTVTLVAQRENVRLLEESLNTYRTLMAKIQYPVSDEQLNIAHENAFNHATKYFNSNVVFDNDGAFYEKFMVTIVQAFADEASRNAEESTVKCKKIVDDLHVSILRNNVNSKAYARAGGYKSYCADLNRLKDEYFKIPGKGVKADEIWQNFLKERESESSIIMAADDRMSEQDQKLEEAENQKKIAEMEAASKEAELKEQSQRLEMLEVESKTQMNNLKEEFEKKQAERAKENEELIDRRLEEQERLLKEGFKQQAENMEREIENLKNQKAPSNVVDAICGVVDRITSVIPGLLQAHALSKAVSGAKGGREAIVRPSTVRPLPSSPPTIQPLQSVLLASGLLQPSAPRF